MRHVNDLQGLLQLASAVTIIFNLIKAVVNRGILARYHSVVGSNVMFLTRHYGWLLDDFVSGGLPLLNVDFMAHYLSTVFSEELRSVYFATKLLRLEGVKQH